MGNDFAAGIYFFNVKAENTRAMCKISSKLTIKTSELRHWRHSGVFIVNFLKKIIHCSGVFIEHFELGNTGWVWLLPGDILGNSRARISDPWVKKAPSKFLKNSFWLETYKNDHSRGGVPLSSSQCAFILSKNALSFPELPFYFPEVPSYFLELPFFFQRCHFVFQKFPLVCPKL